MTAVPFYTPNSPLRTSLLEKGGRVLTTQLYFPDEPRNAREGRFHFVLATG